MKKLYRYSDTEQPTKFIWEKSNESNSGQEALTGESDKKALKEAVRKELGSLVDRVDLTKVEALFDEESKTERFDSRRDGKTMILKDKENDEKIKLTKNKLKIKLDGKVLKVKLNDISKPKDNEIVRDNADTLLMDKESFERKFNELTPLSKLKSEKDIESAKNEVFKLNALVIKAANSADYISNEDAKDLSMRLVGRQAELNSRLNELKKEEGARKKKNPEVKESKDDEGVNVAPVITKPETTKEDSEKEKLAKENAEAAAKAAKASTDAYNNAAKLISELDLSKMTLDNVNDYLGKALSAGDALDKAYKICEGYPEASDLPALKKSLDQEESAIDKAREAISKVDKFKDQIEEKAKERAKMEENLAAKMAEIEKNLENKTPETLEVSALPELNEGNLESLQGTSHEYQKYQMSASVLNKEMAVMNEGVMNFDTSFQEFEASKTELDMNSLLAAGAVAGVYALGTTLAAGITAFTGGVGGLAVPAIIGATGWAASKLGTSMGFGESPDCQQLREKHETIKLAFNEKAPKLSEKQEKLEGYGEKIKDAVSDRGAMANDADEMRAKFADVEQILIDDGVPENLRAEAKIKLEESVVKGLEEPMQSLKSSIEDPEKGLDSVTKINHESVASLAQGFKYIQEDVKVVPPTILDKTLGAAGKAVSKVGNYLEDVNFAPVSFIGGAIDGAGELVGGIGHVIDHPSNLGVLIGIDPSGNEKWPAGWGMLWQGITAKEERLEGNYSAAAGKTAFNVLSIVFGGPKRAYGKIKGALKGGASKVRGIKVPKAKLGGKLGKATEAMKANWKSKASAPRNMIKKLRGKSTPKAEPNLAQLESQLAALEGKGALGRLRNRGARAKLKAEIDIAKSNPKASAGKAPTKNTLKKQRTELGKDMGSLNKAKQALEGKIKAKAKEVDGFSKKTQRAQKDIAEAELKVLKGKHKVVDSKWKALDKSQRDLGAKIKNYPKATRTPKVKPKEQSMFAEQAGSKLASAAELQTLLQRLGNHKGGIGNWTKNRAALIERAQTVFPEQASKFTKGMKLVDFQKTLNRSVTEVKIGRGLTYGVAAAATDMEPMSKKANLEDFETELDDARKMFDGARKTTPPKVEEPKKAA